MSATRQGPALTIAGTCEGCAFALRSGPPMDGEWLYQCFNPSATTEQREHMWTGATPAWCPLLPAARLALARSVVAEAEGTTVASLAADECPGKGRCHGAMKWCETCGPVAGTCDDTACDQHDAAHGADR